MIPSICRTPALAGVLACAALPAAAQWSPDPNVGNPVVIASDNQSPVIAVSDGAGGTIVVWKNARFDAGSFSFFYSARAQRLNRRASRGRWRSLHLFVGRRQPRLCLSRWKAGRD